MSLPEGTSIIREDQRDNFDTYQIGSGRTFCFEFQLETDQEILVELAHTKADAQDLSLRCWFATKPLGQQYFRFIDSLDVYPIPRALRRIPIGAPGTQSMYLMPANQTLYLMVQNMQNSDNIFELAFVLKT